MGAGQKTRNIALALATGLAAAAAIGQTIYRCGDTYSQQRCEGGRALPEAGPAPSAEERAQAQAASRRDAALAATMEKDRLRQEAQAGGSYVPPPRSEPAREPRKSPEKSATRKLDLFTASAPGARPPKSMKAKPEKKKDADKSGEKSEKSEKSEKADKSGGTRTLAAAKTGTKAGASKPKAR